MGLATGALLFSLVNLARQWGLNAEHILRNANQAFIERFMKMEEVLKAMGIEPDLATPSEMDRAWEKAAIKTE